MAGLETRTETWAGMAPKSGDLTSCGLQAGELVEGDLEAIA
jgi:hypothetical protein